MGQVPRSDWSHLDAEACGDRGDDLESDPDNPAGGTSTPCPAAVRGNQGQQPRLLAYTMGARVFTDENGERVVIGFGVAPQTSLMPADRSRASLAAMAAIQRFVSERLLANAKSRKPMEAWDERWLDPEFQPRRL